MKKGHGAATSETSFLAIQYHCTFPLRRINENNMERDQEDGLKGGREGGGVGSGGGLPSLITVKRHQLQ